MTIKLGKRFFNQNYTSYRFYYHRLLLPIKKTVLSNLCNINIHETYDYLLLFLIFNTNN